jgi:hypothetical protein
MVSTCASRIVARRAGQGGARSASTDRTEPRPPLTAQRPDLTLKLKVDDTQMRAAKARHDGGLSGQPARIGIHLGQAREFGRGKDRMRMPCDDGVDPGQMGDRHRRGFARTGVPACRDAGMRQRDHHLGPRLAQDGHPGTGGLGHVAGDKAAFQMVARPVDRLGRGKADQPDADPMGGAAVVGHLPVDQGDRGPVGQILPRPGTALPHQIGAEHRKGRIGQRPLQKIEAIVEFVIAQRRRVIAQTVHRGDGRVDPAAGADGRTGAAVAKGAGAGFAGLARQADGD